MPMENQLAHAITQTEYDSSYDKAAKKLLANKQILAQIMKNCVNEYSACSVDEIAEKYIEGTPEVGTVGVHVDDTNRPKKTAGVITGSNNEDSTLTEGTINYDVRFDAIAPASEGSTAQKDVIRLIINVEAQTAFNPGYPLTKRAIYYCSRMISAQHGPIFTNSEYGKIRKVYSIWVCTHPTKEFQNTLIRYSIRPEQLIGNAVEKSENYDLMSVVTICLGEPGTENYTGIVKFMDVLLSSSRAATEKKKILEEKGIHQIVKENEEQTLALKTELNENPEYSLVVDPTDKYSMSETQKAFIKNYVNFKSIPMAAELTGIDLDTAKSYFVAWSSQQEIRRINKAMYQRQFSHELLTIDELGGYLSSLITDEDVPLADRVKTMDKVRIAQMLIDLQLYKNQAINNPAELMNIDLEGEIKELSVQSIKMLLYQKKSKKENRKDIIDVSANDLLPEEEAFLKTLPADELLKLIDETSKGGNDNGKK